MSGAKVRPRYKTEGTSFVLVHLTPRAKGPPPADILAAEQRSPVAPTSPPTLTKTGPVDAGFVLEI